MQYPPPPAHYKNAANLEPPPVPPQPHIGVYEYPIHTTFSKQMAENESTWKTLFPVGSREENVKALQKLNISLLFNFMELVDIILQDPTANATKVDEIRQIMSSMHHLINSFRPAQAKSFAVGLLQAQIQRRQELLSKVNDSITKADAILTKASAKLQQAQSAAAAARAAASQAASLPENDVNMSMDVDATLDESNEKRPRRGAALAAARAGMLKLHTKMLSLANSSQGSSSSDAMDVS